MRPQPLRRTYTLIVGHCVRIIDRVEGGNYTANYRSGFSIRETFDARDAETEGDGEAPASLLHSAQRFAHTGVFVVVRPEFNDLTDAHGCVIGYREWRSFDGAPLQQVDFPTH